MLLTVKILLGDDYADIISTGVVYRGQFTILQPVDIHILKLNPPPPSFFGSASVKIGMQSENTYLEVIQTFGS